MDNDLQRILELSGAKATSEHTDTSSTKKMQQLIESIDESEVEHSHNDSAEDLGEQLVEEITLEDTQDFHEEFGYLGYVDEPGVFEAEYQGRKVKLNKPMAGDVKKFKVYVKNPKGNVVKVNFGQKGVKIKKDNPERRKSFRARHNCDNPGPKHRARYWSCKAW